jgi:hypothetical protein
MKPKANIEITSLILYKEDSTMDIEYTLNGITNNITFIIKNGMLHAHVDADYFLHNKLLDEAILKEIVYKSELFNKTGKAILKDRKDKSNEESNQPT